MAPGNCSCLLYDLASLEELTQLLSPSVKPVVKDRKHFPLPTSVPKVIYAFTIPRIDSAKKSPLALLGKWGYRKCHFIGIWPAYFICCAFSFCKRRHGEFDGNVTREITFFCAVLKSVPEV